MKATLLGLFALSALAVSSFAQQKVKLNEPFWFGDYTYTFTGAKESKELVRSKYAKKKPEEGAGFFVVYYTVENMTHEPIKGSDFKDLKVKDKNGRTYNANLFNVFYVGENSVISELPPGLPKKTAAVFEMPLSSFEGDASYTVIVPENGDFKGETRELRLVKTAKAAPEANETKSQGKSKGKSKTGT
jgi:hypothetical protein